MASTATSPNKAAMTYTQSGVDIDAGDAVVKLIKPMLRRTHGPRVFGGHGDFAGMFRLDFNEKLFKRNYRDPVLPVLRGQMTFVLASTRIDTALGWPRPPIWQTGLSGARPSSGNHSRLMQ